MASYDVRVTFDAAASMRDGAVLRANIFRPVDDAAQFPVLLTRTPYGKDIGGLHALDPTQAARNGYIVVVQDVRGAFASDGDWFPSIHEADDGEDTIAWAASLPGSNGKVGMFGGSYVGFTQMAVAHRHAESLSAIAPMITWDEAESGVLARGGAAELGLTANWTLLRGFDQLVRRHRGDPRTLGAAIYQLAKELDHLPAEGYAELPLGGYGPLARLDLLGPFAAGIEEPENAAYFERFRVTDAYHGRAVPALHIGGWYDVFLRGTIRNFLGMRAVEPEGQYLLIGPWTHGNFNHVQGERDFGIAAWGGLLDLRTDLMAYQLRFFDRWLKGQSDAFADVAPVRYFAMGVNVWRDAQTWPPAGATVERWYLRSLGGVHGLSRQVPGDEPPDQYVYNPADPAPTIGGATLLHASLRAGPWDQADVEQRPDVLVFTSEPLNEALDVTGNVSVDLYVSTDAPDTDFVARLVDVQPDGRALCVTDGIVRMSQRGRMGATPDLLHAGEVYHVTIDLWATSMVFAPGHRLRVDVTSSSFPRWERNLNTGEPSASATSMRPARQTIYHDATRPSSISLPVLRQ